MRKIVPIQFSSKKFPIINNSWFDLFGQEIRCPNNGVIKNFILRKTKNDYYFDLECYSSNKEEADNGEPIVKSANLTRIFEPIHPILRKDIYALEDYEFDCTPEYGLNGFKLYKEKINANKETIKQVIFCKPTKSSYTTKKSYRTGSNPILIPSLDCFTNILVGSRDTENENGIGYPLRSFKFKIEGNFPDKKCYFLYSYHILKNMGKLKDERLKQMAELRNKNTQVD